ncbi:MAG: GNAT family N-acetyltransferase [Luteitalea sp.]|nr:GNAT family N-acetyltransferase [Luteitalea sp.]
MANCVPAGADTGSTNRPRLVIGAPCADLCDPEVTLRALRSGDAAALLHHISRPEVLRHIAPAPTTVAGFKAFIRWTLAERRRGVHAAFGVVPVGAVRPVGMLQFWPVELDWSTSECCFVIGDEYWGTGLFERGARLMLDFAFDTVGVRRMEARSAAANGRGNGALGKLGATREGTLRGAFRRGAGVSDHVMWSILAEDWHSSRCRGGGQR